MNEILLIYYLTKENEYLETNEEKELYRSALSAALNCKHKIDKEQKAYRRAQNIIATPLGMK